MDNLSLLGIIPKSTRGYSALRQTTNRAIVGPQGSGADISRYPGNILKTKGDKSDFSRPQIRQRTEK